MERNWKYKLYMVLAIRSWRYEMTQIKIGADK